MTDLLAWNALIDRLRTKGAAMFSSCDLPLTEAGPREPGVVALALLSRTISTAEAAGLLLANDMVVEARTLVRTIYENLFYAAALAKKRAAFVEELEFDDLHNRKARAGALLEFGKAQAQKSDFVDKLQTFRDELDARPEKTFSIKFEQAARAGNVLPAFVVYRELSTDAAHPSAESLSRHVIPCDEPDSAPFTVTGYPRLAPTEPQDTAELLASSMLGVLVAVGEVLGKVSGGESLVELSEAFMVLSVDNKAGREIGDRGTPVAVAASTPPSDQTLTRRKV